MGTLAFEMINQEFKAQGTKYQVLPNFGISCRELGVLKVKSLCVHARGGRLFLLHQSFPLLPIV